METQKIVLNSWKFSIYTVTTGVHPASCMHTCLECVRFCSMPRGAIVTVGVCIASTAEQGLSYFCMRACLPIFRVHWLMHAWSTRAVPFTVETLSSIFRFLMNFDLLTEMLTRNKCAPVPMCLPRLRFKRVENGPPASIPRNKYW